nr:DCC1-like thiol-disulfide oxidoreductase family protein [Micromonospora sp. DSM 115978]
MTDPLSVDPGGHGAAGIGHLTVLYDAHCPVCRAARRWLESRAQLVPLGFLPADSPAARRRFPDLDHDASLRDITVVADTGEVYAGDGAWLACLWALVGYRSLADRLARPGLLPVARRVVAAAAALREQTREPGYGDRDDGRDCAEDRCR